ncbi:MAG: fused MFS/spermidine synthase [Deltaproteobacteria bacterium]|nr:fused MFS/spermidine synthase [Deltaproteobacteria bacterium]
MIRSLARTAFFLSGVAGLTFEIVWMRHLGLALGATTLAVATTTAAYMGGLALGSHIGGRFADRIRRPLAVYGGVEIALALSGLAIPTLATYIPTVDEALFTGIATGPGRALVRFAVAALVLIVPTTAMGMTLPILARAVTVRLGQVGREVGLLYAINIAGAMVGAGLAGFVLIPTAGLFATNAVAVGLDLALGGAALAGGLLLPPLLEVTATSHQTAPVLRAGSRPLVALLVVTGMAAMALQVLWTRAIGTALGPSTYAFSAIVCTYLAGLAIGGGLAAWIADRLTAARLALTVILLTTGVASLVGIALVDRLPVLLLRVVLNPHLTMGGLLQTEFGLAALSVLPATIGMGAIFPLTLSAVVGSESRVGAAVGRAYALNTVGNIAGSFAGVFVLLPALGVEWGMRVAALAYLVLAAALLARLEPSVGRPIRLGLVAATAAAGAFGVLWPSWNVPRWTAGTFRMSMTRSFYPDGNFVPSKLLFHKDGLATTVTVEEEEGVRWIKVNGKIDGSSEGDMPTQVLSGVLPMLFHPDPKEVAVIGCGSGVTVGAALAANPAHLSLVELEKAVVEAAALFESVNHLPWNDPRVTVVEDDGRNFMARNAAPFDVIISEPSNPWMTGAASLFTQEFFRIAGKRLDDDGVFLQWLQIYELAPDRIASVIKTFQSVFPNVLVFTPQADSNDLLMLGSRTPVRFDIERLAARFETLREQMTRAGLTRLEDVLALLLFTDRELSTFPADTPLNTDDNAYIEFGAPRDLLLFAEDDPEVPPIRAVRGKRQGLINDLTAAPAKDTPAFMARLAHSYLRQGMIPDAYAAAAEVTVAREAAPKPALAVAREVQDLAHLLEEEDDREAVIYEDAAEADADYARIAKLTLAGNRDQALAEFDRNPGLHKKSGAHSLLYGYLLYHDGKYARAHQVLGRAHTDASDATRKAIAYYLAKDSFEDGEFARAVEEMETYRQTVAGRLSPPGKAE